MNKQEKADLLKGIAKGTIQSDVLLGTLNPTFEELKKYNELLSRETDDFTDEEQRLYDKLHKRKLSLDHLSYPELFYLSCGFFPPDEEHVVCTTCDTDLFTKDGYHVGTITHKCKCGIHHKMEYGKYDERNTKVVMMPGKGYDILMASQEKE